MKDKLIVFALAWIVYRSQRVHGLFLETLDYHNRNFKFCQWVGEVFCLHASMLCILVMFDDFPYHAVAFPQYYILSTYMRPAARIVLQAGTQGPQTPSEERQ